MATKYIKAPFNFVPLSDKVFYPTWANQVSHDVPFSDGESGVIELEIKAETPIYVRNGHTRKDEKAESTNEFNHYIDANGDKKYFIPGTTLKGMFRSVLEIMSFGKMEVDERMKFATREWDNQKIYDLKDINQQKLVRCGYLKFVDNKYTIEDHGEPFRINHKRLDEWLNTKLFEKTFKKDFTKLDDKEKTAKCKYELLLKNEIAFEHLQQLSFDIDNEYATEYQENRVRFSSNGDINGTIVFTGQPDKWILPRKMNAGKFYEFVFPTEIETEHTLDELAYQQFTFIHEDSDDWKFWRKALQKPDGKVPVFFRVENNNIKDFGLAFLYKLPFKHSAKELAGQRQKTEQDKLDLAKCIFGFTTKQNALRGRVQFGNAKAEGVVEQADDVTTVLGSPKASYYPIYVEQKNGIAGLVKQIPKGKKIEKQYSTYHDKNTSLSGWKRYPVKSLSVSDPTGNKDLDTKFTPLKKCTLFIGKVHFHNLREIEIGALLSAITFHNNNDRLAHNVGLAKSMGFGKVKVTMTCKGLRHPDTKYLATYEEAMNKFLGSPWLETPQIKELFTMAYDKVGEQNKLLLEYMHMDNNAENNEFNQAKGLGEYLQRYSELSRSSFKPVSVLENFKQAELEKEKELLIKKQEELNATIQTIQNVLFALDLDTASAQMTIANACIDGYEDKLDCSALDLLKREMTLLETRLSADDAFEQKQWKVARLAYQDLINKSSFTAWNTHIDIQIEICKKNEADNISLEKCIDTTIPIDKNDIEIKKYLRTKGKLKTLPDTDHSTLLDALRIWKDFAETDKDKKAWDDFNFKRSVWQIYVRSWVGLEKALEMYQQIIKK